MDGLFNTCCNIYLFNKEIDYFIVILIFLKYLNNLINVLRFEKYKWANERQPNQGE